MNIKYIRSEFQKAFQAPAFLSSSRCTQTNSVSVENRCTKHKKRVPNFVPGVRLSFFV